MLTGVRWSQTIGTDSLLTSQAGVLILRSPIKDKINREKQGKEGLPKVAMLVRGTKKV